MSNDELDDIDLEESSPDKFKDSNCNDGTLNHDATLNNEGTQINHQNGENDDLKDNED